MNGRNLTIGVFDMQPITPAEGGGRIRLLGAYHDLGHPTSYVGTYDWPGEEPRDEQLTATLREILVPLSDAHFAESDAWRERVEGKTIIDSSFHQLAHLSPDYVAKCHAMVRDVDVVVFSHPWLYPVLESSLAGKLIVYDAHNVEAVLRTMLLDDGAFGTAIAREVVRVEHALCHAADLILACSHEDCQTFHRIFDVPFDKMRVVANGVFTGKIRPASKKTKAAARKRLALPRNAKVALFLASAYEPNREAANFIIDELAERVPEVTFLVCGGVGESLSSWHPAPVPANVVVTGHVGEEEKTACLAAADLAINPMFSGSGTNIKMFDFLAAGLPTVATPVGCRGIEAGQDAFVVAEGRCMASAVRELVEDDELAQEISSGGRRLVESVYSWERISKEAGLLLSRHSRDRDTQRPDFTVIVPSFERHDQLGRLLERLSQQTHDSFEVIVVDQSAKEWSARGEQWGFPFEYVHIDIAGAVNARNLGAFLARGHYLAFTDDDCEPRSDWLASARRYFDDSAVAGVEGLIESTHRDNPEYRTVSNEGFEGFGFMTANLFLRAAVFRAVGGFDRQFDHPHFREDTDLAWRAMEYGRIPFGRDVRVFHPPHPRQIGRESAAERVRFFVRDPLLMKKHPEKYRELFLAEGHYKNTPGFWENFFQGAKNHGIDVPAYYLDFWRQYGASSKSA